MEPYKRYVPIDYAKFAPDLSEAELEGPDTVCLPMCSSAGNV